MQDGMNFKRMKPRSILSFKFITCIGIQITHTMYLKFSGNGMNSKNMKPRSNLPFKFICAMNTNYTYMYLQFSCKLVRIGGWGNFMSVVWSAPNGPTLIPSYGLHNTKANTG